MIYVRFGSRPWHIARTDGHAVCGVDVRKYAEQKGIVIANEATGHRLVCLNCNRMKDADSMDLAASSEDVWKHLMEEGKVGT